MTITRLVRLVSFASTVGLLSYPGAQAADSLTDSLTAANPTHFNLASSDP